MGRGGLRLAFPDHPSARAWYDSAAYQAILPLRSENSDSTVILVDGCDPDHRAVDILPSMRAVAVG